LSIIRKSTFSTDRTIRVKFVLVAALALFSSLTYAEENTDFHIQNNPYSVQKALRWSLIPGGGHYYLGEKEVAFNYMAVMSGFSAGGIWLGIRNDDLGRDDEANTFWLLSLKTWELSVFTTYRSALQKSGYDLKKIGVDNTSVKNLFKAPFRQQNFSDPWVWGFAAFGIAVSAIEAHDKSFSFSDIHRVEILGDEGNREWGTVAYIADAFALSLGAGVSEEALWRGVIQNRFEHRWGKNRGLWASAGIFGTAHFVGLNGSDNVKGALFATAGGWYLGRLYQRNDYQLAKPIAAHFWFNFSVMLTSYLINPDDNALGISFKFDI